MLRAALLVGLLLLGGTAGLTVLEWRYAEIDTRYNQ